MQGRIRSFFLVAMLMLFATAGAQVTTSSMSGKVSAQDESIIGATVVAVHEPSGTRYGTVTNASGQFNLQGMRTGGPYKVEVSYVGYQTAIYTGVNLSLGENYVLNISLKESSELLDEVTVTAQRTVEKMGTVTNVNERQLTTLPTINRSITDFTKLSPYAGGSNSFAGRDGRYNTITIDGAALNNNFGLSSRNMPGGDAQPISLDAIDEISVNVSPYNGLRISLPMQARCKIWSSLKRKNYRQTLALTRITKKLLASILICSRLLPIKPCPVLSLMSIRTLKCLKCGAVT